MKETQGIFDQAGSPYLDKIAEPLYYAKYVEYHDLYLGRDTDFENLTRSIRNCFLIGNDRLVAICGSPGAGKSTFTHCSVKEINRRFQDFGYRAEMIDVFEEFIGDEESFSGHQKTIDFTDIHYVDFFIKICEILACHVSDTEVGPLKASPVAGNYLRKHNDQLKNLLSSVPIDEESEIKRRKKHASLLHMVKSDVQNHAKGINSPLVIFADNVDYIPLNDLKRIIVILSYLTQINPNIKIVFTSRPLSNARVQATFKTYLQGADIKIEEIDEVDFHELIASRFRVGGLDYKNYFSDSAIDALGLLSAGGMDRFLTDAKHIFEIHKDANGSLNSHTEEDLVRDLFNDKNSVRIPDPFEKHAKLEHVPIDWLILAFLESPKFINDVALTEFIEFVEITLKLDQSKKISKRALLRRFYKLIDFYYIRRIKFESKSDERASLTDRTIILGTKCCLTSRGKYVVQNTPLFSELSKNFKGYARGIQRSILAFDTSIHDFHPESANMSPDESDDKEEL